MSFVAYICHKLPICNDFSVTMVTLIIKQMEVMKKANLCFEKADGNRNDTRTQKTSNCFNLFLDDIHVNQYIL